MINREKVIKGLETCVNRVPGEYVCNECPYEIDGNNCEINLTNDAISLLKKQKSEAKWIYGEDKTGVDGWHCSECDFFEPWFYEFTDDIDFIRF